MGLTWYNWSNEGRSRSAQDFCRLCEDSPSRESIYLLWETNEDIRWLTSEAAGCARRERKAQTSHTVIFASDLAGSLSLRDNLLLN